MSYYKVFASVLFNTQTYPIYTEVSGLRPKNIILPMPPSPINWSHGPLSNACPS